MVMLHWLIVCIKCYTFMSTCPFLLYYIPYKITVMIECITMNWDQCREIKYDTLTQNSIQWKWEFRKLLWCMIYRTEHNILFLDLNRYAVSYLHSSNIVRSAVFYLHIQYVISASTAWFLLFLSPLTQIFISTKYIHIGIRGRRSRDSMLVGFTTTYICNQLCCEFELHSGKMYSLSVTCGRSVVFSVYSGYFHQ